MDPRFPYHGSQFHSPQSEQQGPVITCHLLFTLMLPFNVPPLSLGMVAPVTLLLQTLINEAFTASLTLLASECALRPSASPTCHDVQSAPQIPNPGLLFLA
jgi:hypothetical protein